MTEGAAPPAATTSEAPEGQQVTYDIFVMGQKYKVPMGLTIMAAIERAGYQYVRGCGCRAGFCGACSTVYRKGDEQKLHFALACQTQVEDGMYLVQIPFVPATKAHYFLEDLRPDDNVVLSLYPEIARCVACNTCTKSCAQDVSVMMYIQNALRGNIAKAAELSFDCIQCGMCAMRCPADIKHYHVGQLVRRLRGRYLDTWSPDLALRMKDIESGKSEKEIDELMALDKEAITKRYKNREMKL